MDRRFTVDGLELAAPGPAGRSQRGRSTRCRHRSRLPAGAGGGINSVASFPQLADRIATEHGWAALAYASRGIGESEVLFAGRLAARFNGDPTSSSVRRDRWAVSDRFRYRWRSCDRGRRRRPAGSGVAAVGAPADFEDWALSPQAPRSRQRDEPHPRPFVPWCSIRGLKDWSARCRCCIATGAPGTHGRARRRRRIGAGLRRSMGRRWSRSRRPAHRAGGRTPPPPRPTGDRDCSGGSSGSALRWAAAPNPTAGRLAYSSLALPAAFCAFFEARTASRSSALPMSATERLVIAERGRRRLPARRARRIACRGRRAGS